MRKSDRSCSAISSLRTNSQRRANSMSSQGASEVTRDFYEQFPFPGTRPIDRDGLIFMRRFAQSIERARGITSERLNVLDAGCGTGNTTLSLARRFNEVQFTG